MPNTFSVGHAASRGVFEFHVASYVAVCTSMYLCLNAEYFLIDHQLFLHHVIASIENMIMLESQKIKPSFKPYFPRYLFLLI